MRKRNARMLTKKELLIKCWFRIFLIIKYSVICTIVLAYLTYIWKIFSGRRRLLKKPKNESKLLPPSYEHFFKPKKKTTKKQLVERVKVNHILNKQQKNVLILPVHFHCCLFPSYIYIYI